MINNLYLVPNWFFNIDIILGISFALIAFVVATYAFRINRITGELDFNLFGMAFLFIGLSYLIRTIMNSFLGDILSNPLTIFQFLTITRLSELVIYLYALLFITGYGTFAFTTIKTKCKRAYFMMIAPSLLAFFLSYNKPIAIYLITTVFLLPICFHYGRLFINNKETRRAPMFIATSLLLLSNLIFLSVAVYSFYEGYIISAVLELLAYLIIGFSLYNVITHGEKKK